MRNTMSAMLAVILMICMSQTVLISEPLSITENVYTDSGHQENEKCTDSTIQMVDIRVETFRKGAVHVCDEETGNWTVLDDKQTTDQEWIVEQGCDAPTEQQFNDTNLAEVLNDYGQVMVAGSDWKNNTNQSWYDMVAATSTGHDDPNDPMIHFETRIVSGCSGQLCRGVYTADEPIYMRNTAIQIGPDIVIEISVSEEFRGNSNGNGGTITEYGYSASFNGSTVIFTGLQTPKVHFNGSTVIVSITNSTGYEVINVTQTQDIIGNGTGSARWSNNTMYDSYDGATVQTNTHISIAKALNIYAVLTGGNESTSARGVRSGYDVDLSYSETAVGTDYGVLVDLNDSVVENERTGLLFLKGKAIQVGFGEDGDVTEANIIKTNLTIDESVSPEIAEEIIDSALRTPGKGIDIAGGPDYRCEGGDVSNVYVSIDDNSKLRLASDDEKQEDSEILVSAAGVDVTERDAIFAGAAGGTVFVFSALYAHWRHKVGAARRAGYGDEVMDQTVVDLKFDS